ncbi:biotin--[acetyl-CoA-carboxylase] ligase [Ameyamaea chiangmaiensis]|uniref:biotin--[biotin carboxyl-carrier protein] ligase n=1 Tax=Ameyamaea chiangmaiensis TaxID=442969 RepID=A0A850PEL9_9PROT|nr:biotin--[acetyl-CoA-carboxylase] ligase [Ameyamaea chiangmaiensis]NVN39511.1 biotin--[acetyl-CoA-carboxylase] ligase [Ameyamaea chiangmaiensis]
MEATLSPPGWRLQCYTALGSTSDVCKEAAERGEAGGRAVLARAQTAARASRGRTWQEPEGNLALSALLRPPADDQAGYWPFIAALAFHDGLRAQAGAAGRLSLKWPNDVLLDGRKLGGILIERGLDGAGTPWMVIGFGANLRHVPDVPGRSVACLAETGARAPDAVAVALDVLPALTRWEAVAREQGFGAIRAEWLGRAHPIGTPLAVRCGTDYVEGSFQGLDEQGFLLLRSPDAGILRISTGDVLLLAS